MTSKGRGGPRVPDGKPRPDPVPYSSGPNRTDLSALPGTPGTPLPNTMSPNIPHGEETAVKRALADIPLESFQPGQGGGLMSPSAYPNEPLTAGIDMGAGPGSESLIPTEDQLGNQLAAKEMRYAYPIIMRLASLPNATSQTKILAQRLRAMLPVDARRMPLVPQELEAKIRAQETSRGIQ